jgi:hypothetical protein
VPASERNHANLYLYEVIDIVGQGQYEYMEHLWKDPVQQMPDMFKLQGAFYVLGAGGGRWPEVHIVWDVPNGWEGWAANADRLNLKRRKAFYGDWWDQAAKWRTGGFDRLCIGAPGSPTTEEIAAAGIKGSLFVSERVTVRAGAQADYLEAVRTEKAPLLAEHGHRLTGLYEVTGNRTEVVVMWATSISARTAYQQARYTTRGWCGEGATDDRIAAWEARALDWITGGTELQMTPLPRTVYGPEDWEDASLEQWFKSAR